MTYRTLIILLVVVAACQPLASQIPTEISVQMYLEEGGLPVNGQRQLDVAWYVSPVGGVPLHEETFTTDVVGGVATLLLGSTTPLPQNMLLQGPFWLGIRIDGGVELQPRTALASVPYAMLADRARIAQALAPEVTGVVTSLNEIAGPVQVVNGEGLRLDRRGQTITLSASTVIETGVLDEVAGQYRFTVVPLTLLRPDMLVQAVVHAPSMITARVVDVDYLNNTITIETAAPLAAGEYVVWTVY